MTLPASVRDLALRLGADPSPRIEGIKLEQTGEMKLGLHSKTWLPFRAQQSMSIKSCAFSWRAKFWPFGFLSVVDALEADRGQLNVTAFGLIPLVRTPPTAALTKGEMLRYLAELPFAPDAMLHNTSLTWRELGSNQFAVSQGQASARAEVIFTLDADGRVGDVMAQDRPRSATPPVLPTPWHGTFSDYRCYEGRWLPCAGQVAWVIDGQEVPYWRGIVTNWATQVTSNR
jgi:hypothetical protein